MNGTENRNRSGSPDYSLQLPEYQLLAAGWMPLDLLPRHGVPQQALRDGRLTSARELPMRVERFGKQVIARECQVWGSAGPPRQTGIAVGQANPHSAARAQLLEQVDAWYVADQWIGTPDHLAELTQGWKFPADDLNLWLRLTPSGQVGFFPEHAGHWHWLQQTNLAGRKIINLFAYTGAMSLKLASLGASVTHVDASKSAVNWARRNSETAGLTELPVRWIVEDARRFVQRELKRGNSYDGFVCDPPSFGRPSSGSRSGSPERNSSRQVWKIEKDLPELLDDLLSLTQHAPHLALVTSHTPGCEAKQLVKWLHESMHAAAMQPLDWQAGAMRIAPSLASPMSPALPCGWFCRTRFVETADTSR